MSVIYQYRAGINKFLDENFHSMKRNILARVGQSLGWPSQHVTKSRQANVRPELFWTSFPIWWALTAKCRSLPVSYDEKSCLVQTQVRFYFRRFQLTVQIRAWELIQGKEQVELKQAQELFCLRELVVSSNPRSEPETAKMLFFLKNHSKRWLLALWRDNQLETSWHQLKLVDTELTLHWFALVPTRWWVVPFALTHYV